MNRRIAAAFFLMGVLVLAGAITSPAFATKPNPEHKITICHTAQGTNPHTIEVDYEGALGHANSDPFDIIPPFPGFAGQGDQSLLETECKLPVTTSTLAPTTTVTTLPTTSTTVTTAPTTTTIGSTTTTLPTVTTPPTSEVTTTWQHEVTTTTTRSTPTSIPTTTLPLTDGTTINSIPTTVTPTTPGAGASSSTSLTALPSASSHAELPVTGVKGIWLGLLAGFLILVGVALMVAGR